MWCSRWKDFHLPLNPASRPRSFLAAAQIASSRSNMSALADLIADAKKLESKTFTMKEVAKHSAKKDCWMVIGGRVFDTTKFLDEHPGGPEIMTQQGGAWSQHGASGC